MSAESLGDRFGRIWRRVGATNKTHEVFHDLYHAWTEPHRRYHGVDHLRDCLTQLDDAPASAADRDLAEIALWFHDAVYRPGSPDNESRSAEWAVRALLEAGVSTPRAGEVARLVLLTDHARPVDDPTGALVCDVDLSILGRPAAEFAEYERRIRVEYGSVPDQLYRQGRAAVLQRLLARDRLYRTAHFSDRYEAAARRNLMRSLETLGH
jgi:predicted metal-dependent HD superfamily phosphohydrolase